MGYGSNQLVEPPRVVLSVSVAPLPVAPSNCRASALARVGPSSPANGGRKDINKDIHKPREGFRKPAKPACTVVVFVGSVGLTECGIVQSHSWPVTHTHTQREIITQTDR